MTAGAGSVIEQRPQTLTGSKTGAEQKFATSDQGRGVTRRRRLLSSSFLAHNETHEQQSAYSGARAAGLPKKHVVTFCFPKLQLHQRRAARPLHLLDNRIRRR